MEDNSIINEILQGQKELYSVLMEKYHNEIFKFLYNTLGNYETTEDLIQEIFFKVYKQLNKYNSRKAQFRTWLYRISNNHLINYLNSKDYKTHKNLTQYEDYNNIEKSKVEEEMLKDEQVKEVIRILKEKVNPKYHEVFILYYFGSKKVKEISATLDINEKTVYYALNTSVEIIKKEVQL